MKGLQTRNKIGRTEGRIHRNFQVLEENTLHRVDALEVNHLCMLKPSERDTGRGKDGVKVTENYRWCPAFQDPETPPGLSSTAQVCPLWFEKAPKGDNCRSFSISVCITTENHRDWIEGTGTPITAQTSFVREQYFEEKVSST